MSSPTFFTAKDGTLLSITLATPQDIPTLKSLIDAAYSKYIPLIGRPPAPMTTDYTSLPPTYEIYILTSPNSSTPSRILGSIILAPDKIDVTALHINNLVVDPTCQGKGYGKVLMMFAEVTAKSKALGVLTLYTNVKMEENLIVYPRMGFEEVERRNEDGFERVFFRKVLV